MREHHGHSCPTPARCNLLLTSSICCLGKFIASLWPSRAYISRAYGPCTHILAKTNNSLLDVTPSNPLPHPLPPPPILLHVILSCRGKIKQMSCIPQMEQHSPFGLMLLHLGNVTIILQIHLTHAHTFLLTHIQVPQQREPKYKYTPNDYLTCTIITTILCGLFSPLSIMFTIPAIIFARKVRVHWL